MVTPGGVRNGNRLNWSRKILVGISITRICCIKNVHIITMLHVIANDKWQHVCRYWRQRAGMKGTMPVLADG